MSHTNFHLLVIVLIASLLSFASLLSGGSQAPVFAQQNSQTGGDISGGASILLKRPKNPEVHRRKKQPLVSSGVSSAKPETSKQLESEKESTTGQDELEDALALGNAARDREPQDFQSAERAYRLGIKLAPIDPRPYVGLGNIFYDQKRFAEAADAYRRALKLASGKAARMFGGVPLSMSKLPPTVPPISDDVKGQWHSYLASTLVQEREFASAEMELRQALSVDPHNPQLFAILGYVLSSQGQYREASDSYRQALEADPTNRQYEKISKEALSKSEAASAQDNVTTKALRGTRWNVDEPVGGVCQLENDGTLQCKDSNRNLRFHDGMQWRIKEGLLEIFLATDAVPSPRCIGHKQEDLISLKCIGGISLSREVWKRRF